MAGGLGAWSRPRVTEALVRVGVVTLEVPGSGTLPRLACYTRRQEAPRRRRRRSPHPHSLKDVLRRPDLHTASRLPGVPRCPGTVRHRTSPAPPRPGRQAWQRAGAVGPGARTPGSAFPRPSHAGLGPAPRRIRSRLLGAAQPGPALVRAQWACAELDSAVAGWLATYCACTGFGGGTFCVWRVCEMFILFFLGG